MPERLEIRRANGKIWSHVRQEWLVETPEETVRQSYLCVLVNEYGFAIDQIGEEVEVTGRGAGQARADFAIWRAASERAERRTPLIVVECKSDNVTITAKDYGQGDNYARLTNARFLITHNSRETKYWRVRHDEMPKSLEEISNVPRANASDLEIEELLSTLKIFKEDEFAKLLHECHNVIRNREKLDPAAAFDEIAKILFVKVYVERELRNKRSHKNLFTVDYLDEQIGRHPLNVLFEQTKDAYAEDRIFETDEEIRLKPATGREIVKRLERYNLSDTSEDIKGIAFERFLGRTFRGEIGQFFTPRTIVEFMISAIAPQEGETLCDPASGSGGFLIRFFEIVREQILASADADYQSYKESDEVKTQPQQRAAELLRERYSQIQATLNPRKRGSRLWHLANRCIYGTDANDRMARTSKMNMIMHGDGHAGVHHHDGFLNTNGIFEGRFDIILTNPPFGASVEPSDLVHESDISVNREDQKRYREEYGAAYDVAIARTAASVGKPITSLFKLPGKSDRKIKTEILFVERCLSLLKPGGRMGIVLPEGIFNNPSLVRVREFCEHQAFIRAIVSLPQETFYSSGASVKASLLFLQKFTDEEQEKFNSIRDDSLVKAKEKHSLAIAARRTELEARLTRDKDSKTQKETRAALRDYLREMEKVIREEARADLKDRFSYSIFLYEAEKVGITATGEADQNELVPNDNFPSNLETSCLELFRHFVRNSNLAWGTLR